MILKSVRILSSAIAIATLATVSASPVFAWPTKGQEVTCNKIHWEMQNDTNKTYEFVGKVIEPVSYEVKQNVKPNDWGVLDKSWNLTGKVKVKATISMGGDTRVVEKSLDCPVPTPTPSPSPTPTPTPSPTPTVSPTPCPTPTPEPCTTCGGNDNDNNQEQDQVQNNNQTVNVTVPQALPETGVGSIAMATMFGGAPLGLVISKWGKGKLGAKKEEEIEEFASRIFSERASQ